MQLGIPGFSYEDLRKPERLRDLLDTFDRELAAADADLYERYRGYHRARGQGLPPVALSELLVALAPRVGAFVTRLFGIEDATERLKAKTVGDDAIFRAQREFIARKALRKSRELPVEDRTLEELEGLMAQLRARVLGSEDDPADAERSTARAICALLDRDARGEDVDADMIIAERWKRAMLPHEHEKPKDHRRALFFVPEDMDFANLVEMQRPDESMPGKLIGPDRLLRRRQGFGLTDGRMDRRHAMGHVHYCLYCQDRDKDSCSKGLRAKDGTVKKNPLGIPLEGCPLGEKIGEMHSLIRMGESIAALAAILIDNPMAPGTGHRICNDCMKACVFQKQEPVNIPQVETRILTDVIHDLPYGFEVYDLLTRWNPLNARRPIALPYNGKHVLVVGLGPAGYTLAHHLLNEGFGVVAVDGLKIEPLSGVDREGGDVSTPVEDYQARLAHTLDERILTGFGGVSEYGITVRWDKNFLDMLYVLLARRSTLKIYGGVRFGGTLTLDDAWALGFDHVALATGAGRPTIVKMKNNLIRGVRKASDFLMALQLQGAFKGDTLANLQVRLPAIVIGGGLTAIDTATELLAYYPVQVDKMLSRYEALCAARGEAAVRKAYDAEELSILDELCGHGRAVRAERARAKAAGEAPDLISLVRGWGGVKIAYRRELAASPAYRLNHEEVIKSLEEGIEYIEKLSPTEAIPDEHGHVRALVFEDTGTKARVELAARTVMVAAGTHPNTMYEKENPGTFKLLEKAEHFQCYRARHEGEDGKMVLEPAAAGDPEAFFTSYDHSGKLVSCYGDNHAFYEGNVVKAMASALHGYRHVAGLFPEAIARAEAGQGGDARAWQALAARLDDELLATVVRVDRLTPTIVEVIVRARAASRKFHPGQFYRLQNFESLAPKVGGTRLVMEGVALTGAWTDPERGLLSLIVLEMGHSSRMCAHLRPGEPVVVMGPTGTPTEIPRGETVLLAGGGLGNAVLFSIAKALKESGCKVLYFAGYRRKDDLFKQEEIEAATDQVIYAVDAGEPIAPRRPQDRAFVGNIVQAIGAYGEGKLGERMFDLHGVQRIIAIGSDRMMNAVRVARKRELAPLLSPGHEAIGSINSPMQCMMKEVCAQCLQKHVDPETGAEKEVVFSCFNQDQPLDRVDFANLAARLRANTVQEKLGLQWFEHVTAEAALPRV